MRNSSAALSCSQLHGQTCRTVQFLSSLQAKIYELKSVLDAFKISLSLVGTARDAIAMQKICCQGNRGEREREVEMSPEYQDCCCRRRAQRSALSASLPRICKMRIRRSLHMWTPPLLASNIKTEFYFRFCVQKCHTRERRTLYFIYQFPRCFISLTLFLTSGPLIRSLTSSFFFWLPLPKYRHVFLSFLFVSVYTCLVSHPLTVCQTALSAQP